MGAHKRIDKWLADQRRALDDLEELKGNMFECDPSEKASKAKSDVPQEVLDNYTLAFEDTFQGPELDYSKWNTRFPWGPGLTINREEQYYTDTKNGDTTAPDPFSFNQNGLVITASPIPEGSRPNNQQGIEGGQRYSSGIITTRDSLCFTYGYVEVCCKPPCGVDGSWLAAWLLNCMYYDNAAEKAQAEGIENANDKFEPEMDFEWVNGSDSFNSDDCVKMAYHYHTGDRQSDTNHKRWTLDPANFREFNFNTNQVDSATNQYEGCGGETKSNMPQLCQDSNCGEFQTVGFHWTEDFIRYYVGGQLVNCIEGPANIITDQAMYLLLNFAVGGNYPFPDGQLTDEADYPATFEIEYARIYLP